MSKWEEKMLGELIISSKGKLTKQSEFLEDGFQPLINADAINGRETIFSDTKGAVLCEEDDVLMLWDGERSGLVTFGFKGVVGSTFAKLKTLEALDSKYLFYLLNEKFLWIQNNRTGTGVPHVPKDLERILIVKYPKDKTEQRQIATILSTADAVIEKTQAAITKYKAIKQGMLQDLFTRGIDTTTGKLRPSYQDAPELYKESKLGWIPKEWEVVTIENIAKVHGRVGWKGYTVSDLRETGPLALGATHIDKENKLDLSKPVHLSMDKFIESPEIMVYFGDILIVQRGTIGKIVIIDREIGDATINPSMVILNTIKINSFFLYFQLCSFIGQRQIELLTSQTGVPMISQKQINSIKIAIPKNDNETNSIAIRIQSIDKIIFNEEKLLSKQQQIKAGLMNDLLSGKKKVIVKELETQTENN